MDTAALAESQNAFFLLREVQVLAKGKRLVDAHSTLE